MKISSNYSHAEYQEQVQKRREEKRREEKRICNQEVSCNLNIQISI
jgi:hypothetical protein